MTWKEGKNREGTDKYYLANGDYTICKIGNKPSYELWLKAERLGQFESADLAKQQHAILTKGE